MAVSSTLPLSLKETVTTLMIALVTGIAIAALVVLILDFCIANFSSSAILSGCC